MSELNDLVERIYELAKQGEWGRVLAEWEESPLLGRRCSRHQNEGSRWSFLHQAAYFGNEVACRELIRLGSSPSALTHDSQAPADVAKSKGYGSLSELLRSAVSPDEKLWGAPMDPDVLPSSNRWDEAIEHRATGVLYVAYAGGLVIIEPGRRYYTDSFGRVIIGWHGSFDPPSGMDGESML